MILPDDIADVPRDELPALLGRLVELEARVRLRLADVPTVPTTTTTSKQINHDEAALIANTSKRWLLTNTRGMKFRCDLSRKQPRFNEAGLRAWLSERRRS